MPIVFIRTGRQTDIIIKKEKRKKRGRNFRKYQHILKHAQAFSKNKNGFEGIKMWCYKKNCFIFRIKNKRKEKKKSYFIVITCFPYII